MAQSTISSLSEGYRPISDYGIIGDTRGVALVNREGSIDWCALPHIDSPAFLLKLLDVEQGGCFQIRPAQLPFSVERRYLDDTNVLATTFTTPTGTVRLIDTFVAPSTPGGDEEPPHQILRLLECFSGTVEVELICHVTPDFARREAEADHQEPTVVRWSWADDEVWLSGNWPVEVEGTCATSRCRMRTGDRLFAVLSNTRPDNPTPTLVRRKIDHAIHYWRDWVRTSTYSGVYRDMVIRSALTLKLLTFKPTGAIVAAATTSLPEEICGVRNWDYRYCWLRDASLTIWALGLLGFYDEAYQFTHWVLDRHIASEDSGTQIMYGVRGEHDLQEQTLDHLDGYRGSRPVRTGNDAYRQKQLDIYGGILDSVYLFYHVWNGLELYGYHGARLEGPIWEMCVRLVEAAIERWEEPDHGIWEVRGGPQHFVHSKMMCWVAVQRGIRLAEEHDLPADLERWRAEKNRIRKAILEHGYSEEVGAFTQAFDSNVLDASVLLMPMVHFIKGTDRRMVSTIDAIKKHLMRDGLVYRYIADDGLPGGEGTFSICGFWMVDNLVFCGRVEEARDLFASMLNRANDLGLYSEEIDIRTGEFLGNFPQAFTHMALINAAINLHKAENREQGTGSRAM